MFGLEEFLIQEKGFENIVRENKKIGYKIDILLPFYRALPLSNIVDISLKVDSEEIDKKNIRLKLRNNSYAMDKMTELNSDDDWWGFDEKASLIVIKNGGLAPGEHKIEMYMRYRWPIGIPDENGVLRRMHDDNKDMKTLVIQS